MPNESAIKNREKKLYTAINALLQMNFGLFQYKITNDFLYMKRRENRTFFFLRAFFMQNGVVFQCQQQAMRYNRLSYFNAKQKYFLHELFYLLNVEICLNSVDFSRLDLSDLNQRLKYMPELHRAIRNYYEDTRVPNKQSVHGYRSHSGEGTSPPIHFKPETCNCILKTEHYNKNKDAALYQTLLAVLPAHLAISVYDYCPKDEQFSRRFAKCRRGLSSLPSLNQSTRQLCEYLKTLNRGPVDVMVLDEAIAVVMMLEHNNNSDQFPESYYPNMTGPCQIL